MPSQTAFTPGEQPEDIAEPARLVLQERLIVEGTSTAYRMDQSVTSPLKSSIVFERVQPETAPQHVFYLVHPPHAQYRTDKPAYYMTAVATPALGNMRLAPSKQHLQRPSFTGMLSPGRTSSHAPLFAAAEVEQRVFRAQPRWTGGRHAWMDGDGGGGVARSAPMERARRDALVALWVLRIWHDVAESKEARRAELERMMPPQPVSAQDKMGKRTAALGSLAAGG